MPRFIAVVHTWFHDSKGFEVHELGTNRNVAELDAHRITERGRDTFNSRAFCLLEIHDHEQITERKLTWKERLTGRLTNG